MFPGVVVKVAIFNFMGFARYFEDEVSKFGGHIRSWKSGFQIICCITEYWSYKIAFFQNVTNLFWRLCGLGLTEGEMGKE